jgi:hypothetical protein
VAALFVIGIFSIGFVIAFQLVQILSVDWERLPHSVGRREHSKASQRGVR